MWGFHKTRKPTGQRAVPTIYGRPLITMMASSANYLVHKDSGIPTCGDGFKIIREWIVLDWCSGKQRRFNAKMIKSMTMASEMYKSLDGTSAYKC